MQATRGSVDIVDCTTGISGWAQEQDMPDAAISVNVYIDAPQGASGTILMGSITAGTYRDDLCSGIGSCAHGFTMSIPAQYQDGQSHSVYVYGVVSDGTTARINSTPKFFQCAPHIAQPTFNVAFNNGSVSVDSVGSVQTVFNHSTQACQAGDADLPDTPAHAFRNASGKVILISSNATNFQNIGTTLDNVVHSCNPSMASANNPDFNALQSHEWNHSGGYTLDFF